MRRYDYRILNVFSLEGDVLSGNPLCVFEDGEGLTDREMQGLARQFNLSETTFLLPSQTANARVRIFTPAFEMPFAGHPTLGTAHVVRALGGGTDALTLQMAVGIIDVRAQGDTWTLRAPAATAAPVDASREQLAAMLGIDASHVGASPMWVDAGNRQLLVAVTSREALMRCQPGIDMLRRYASVNAERCIVYVFSDPTVERMTVRLFFGKGSAVVEDPATGSACANLGGYLLATGAELPLSRVLEQGEAVGRPSRLTLHVAADRSISVSGRVTELGAGYVTLP